MYFNNNENDALINIIKGMSEKVEFPHAMYNPENGDEVIVRNKEEHEKYKKMGWTHTRPVAEVEEPQPKGEKEFKALHTVKVSGKNPDGTDIKEAAILATLADIFESIDLDENAYKEFFQKALKKFGVKSPAELDDEKKKEFFDYVDKNWKG